MSKKTEVAKKEETQVAFPVGNWGEKTYSAKSLIIPKILAMQGLSKLVLERKAMFGDLIDSLNSSKLGDIKEPLEFIPFSAQEIWIIYKVSSKDGKSEYIETTPVNASNDNWRYEENINGTMIRRDRAINVYCLLPKEIKEGMYMPYCISFRRTSLQAGKKIVTAFTRLQAFGKPPAGETFELSASQTSNEKGTYIVFDVKRNRQSTNDEIAACYKWFQTISKSSYEVDNADLESSEEATQERDLSDRF